MGQSLRVQIKKRWGKNKIFDDPAQKDSVINSEGKSILYPFFRLFSSPSFDVKQQRRNFELRSIGRKEHFSTKVPIVEYQEQFTLDDPWLIHLIERGVRWIIDTRVPKKEHSWMGIAINFLIWNNGEKEKGIEKSQSKSKSIERQAEERRKRKRGSVPRKLHLLFDTKIDHLCTFWNIVCEHVYLLCLRFMIKGKCTTLRYSSFMTQNTLFLSACIHWIPWISFPFVLNREWKESSRRWRLGWLNIHSLLLMIWWWANINHSSITKIQFTFILSLTPTLSILALYSLWRLKHWGMKGSEKETLIYND